jgi:hypothetical protein
MVAQSEIFSKGKAEDFNKILKRQKKDESDPKFAISDSLQEYQQQLEISAGYQNHMKLNKANIRKNITDFVINYTFSDLEELKGMDFDDAKTRHKTTEKTIKEFEGLHRKGILEDEEIIYIKETVGRTNAQLGKILGLSTKLSLAFRDFKKELKPLKLARRMGLTNVPIIGKRIERAITAQEDAESKSLGIKRALRTKEAKSTIKSGGGASAGLGALGGKSSGGDKEDLAQRATRDLFGDQEPSKAAGYSKETAVEEERESDKQFDTSSNLLERILEESELTNELLGKDSGPAKKQRSLLSKLLEPLAYGMGLGLIFKNSISSLGTTLGNSMSTMWQGTKSLLGFGKGKTPAVAGAGKNAAKTALRTGAATTTATTTAAAKSATKNLVKENVKKGAKVAGKAVKGIARVGGRIFLPLAAAMSIFDAASGVAQAGELLGKEDEDLTFRDKASSGFAGFLSGLTFGLVDKKKMANKLAGDSGSSAVADQHDDLGLIENTSQKKLDKVEELKVNNIDRLITKSDDAKQTTIIKQGDTVNQENKSVYEGATIGTYVPERKMYHDIR